jgi:hypothetical protein
MAPTDYVSDFESLTDKFAGTRDVPVETKVITAPVVEVAPATVAEVK